MGSMWWPCLVLVCGCYAATPPSGAPCDPSAPACPSAQACIAGTCQIEGALGVDAGGDAPPVARACPADPALALCLSFDAPFTSPLANEGALPLAATFTDVSHLASGAALFGATSTMQFPASARIAGIRSVEVTLRLDAAPPVMSRVGIVDSDISDAGISLFIYGGSPHRISCTLGADALLVDSAFTLGAWTTIACACENARTVIRRDGVMLANAAGCSPGSAETSGLQIGQNSRGGAMLPPNEPLIGAIDRVQLWSQ